MGAELKRACCKLNWPGDIKLLFFCLDVDGSREAESGKKALRLEEVLFLDSWHVEPTIQELDAEEAALAPPKPKASSEDRRCWRTATERLTTPHMPVQRSLPTLHMGSTQSLPTYDRKSRELFAAGQSGEESLPLLTEDVRRPATSACTPKSPAKAFHSGVNAHPSMIA